MSFRLYMEWNQPSRPGTFKNVEGEVTLLSGGCYWVLGGQDAAHLAFGGGPPTQPRIELSP